MQAANIRSCTCPQATHTANKRTTLRLIWRSQEWLKESAAYKARHFPVCSRCGRVGPIVPGHSGEDYTPSQMKYYTQKVRDDQVVPLCHQCNKMEARGRHPCPVCIEKHREDPDHFIRYIARDRKPASAATVAGIRSGTRPGSISTGTPATGMGDLSIADARCGARACVHTRPGMRRTGAIRIISWQGRRRGRRRDRHQTD